MSALAPAHRRPAAFRLTRFFSLTSLLGIAAVTACLFWAYRDYTLRQLVAHESRANADLAQAFANAVWRQHRAFVLESGGRGRDALLADPRLAALRADVLATMKGLKVAKIKVYNLDGLTVFSTDARQVGEDKRGNAGFQGALAGRVVSEITYRDRFDAFEGTLSDRNLIFSYVPVRLARDAAPEGVIEVYSDVTELIQRLQRAQWQIAAIVGAALGALYLFLFFVVRKADRIMATQERERAAQEDQIRHQAYHDALTGLPNRASFADRMAEVLAHARRHRRSGALMFIDLDRFKFVNDSLGHPAGDLLLKETAARLGDCLRASDVLFRMGGDEFMVVLPEIDTPEAAAHVAQRIIQAVARPVAIYEHELTVGATVGIAVFPGDGDDAQALVKNADAAMYSAKQAGRGTHAFYRSEMNERALQRLRLETALLKAFRDGEFTLYYQPRLDGRTRRVVALEALLRWASPRRGLVAPGEFIGVLEDTGMMPIVGEWVLRSACIQLRHWQAQGRSPVRVSVNVSARQFQAAGFAAMVARVLGDTAVNPALVELELTESLLITNPAQAGSTLAALKALGVSVSIDDFGTGYSSLNYLRHMAVDYLKIDRSFVREVESNARDRAVVTAIADLAHALGITLVAEGVETEAQAAFFSQIRCGELQGFLFWHPLPAEQAAALLDAGTVERGRVSEAAPGPDLAPGLAWRGT